MAGMNIAKVDDHLVRTEVWSSELKEILRDEMMAQKYVRMLEGFPDGNTFTIPTIKTIGTNDYTDDTAVTYDQLDTAEFQFTIDKYLTSATYITKQSQQDSWYAGELESRFVPEQARAIMEHFETTSLKMGETAVLAGAGVDSEEVLDGAKHRYQGSGTGGKIGVKDFAYARYALKKSKVPDRGLVAIVDPSVEYELSTLSQLTSVSNNPSWEGIIRDGATTGMRFIANIYGFDVYTSNMLSVVDATTGLTQADGTAGADLSAGSGIGVANLFFSSDAATNPFVGAWRQMPEVDYEYNKDYQRHEYVTSSRYGVKLSRPEGLVTVVTTSVV